MGLQENSYSQSSIFLGGCFRITECVTKIHGYIKSSIAKYIVGFDDSNPDNWNWNNWELFLKSMECFIKNPTAPYGGLSKYYDTIGGHADGNENQWQSKFSDGSYVMIYEMIKTIIKEDLPILSFSDDRLNMKTKKWRTLSEAYESIKAELDTIISILYSISHFYRSPKSRLLSPKQYQTFESSLLKTSLIINENFIVDSQRSICTSYRIPWETIELMFPILINKILNGYWKDIYKGSIDNVSDYEFSEEFDIGETKKSDVGNVEVSIPSRQNKYIFHPIGVTEHDFNSIPDCLGFRPHFKSNNINIIYSTSVNKLTNGENILRNGIVIGKVLCSVQYDIVNSGSIIKNNIVSQIVKIGTEAEKTIMKGYVVGSTVDNKPIISFEFKQTNEFTPTAPSINKLVFDDPEVINLAPTISGKVYNVHIIPKEGIIINVNDILIGETSSISITVEKVFSTCENCSFLEICLDHKNYIHPGNIHGYNNDLFYAGSTAKDTVIKMLNKYIEI